LGGPRKKGNTATVLAWVEEELKSLGHEVDRVNVVDYKVNGCLSCYRCQEVPDEPGCVQRDDAVALFERMMAADVIVFSSPLFVWSFAAQIKALIDRMFCLVKAFSGPPFHSLIAGKKSALLITCGGPKEGNADLVIGMYNRFSDYASMLPIAELVVPFCTTPDQLNEEAKAEATALASRIAS
jgi:multimeric flavodoxin WrbA